MYVNRGNQISSTITIFLYFYFIIAIKRDQYANRIKQYTKLHNRNIYSEIKMEQIGSKYNPMVIFIL